MVTYRFRLSKLQVRILVPHPLLILLLLLPLLTVPVSAADDSDQDTSDYYLSIWDEPLFYALNPPITGNSWSGLLFGVRWNYQNGLITKVGPYTMTGRADGVQELATELFDLAVGIDARIDEVDLANNSTVVDLLDDIKFLLGPGGSLEDWLRKIYSGVDSLEGKTQNLYQQFEKLFTKMDSDRTWWSTYYKAPAVAPLMMTGSQSMSAMGYGSVTDNLVAINRNLVLTLTNGGWHWLTSSGGIGTTSNTALGVITANGFLGLGHLLFGAVGHDIYGLSSSGLDKTGQRGNWSLADISANGFSGLATLIAGTSDNGRKAQVTYIDPDTLALRSYEESNLFDLIADVGSWLQVPLARLAYVYASEEDILFKDAEKENEDTVKDEFFGDGSAAIKPSDIKDAAGLTSGAAGAFGGAGSAGDVFTVLQSEDAFSFFSQQVADSLDQVGKPAVQSDDDIMDDFVEDDSGFYHVDSAFWDVSAFLGGLDDSVS